MANDKATEKTDSSPDQEANIAQIQKRLDLFDQRLDNIDSIVTAVAERVMKQPIVLNVTCTHCGHNIEIAIVSNARPTR